MKPFITCTAAAALGVALVGCGSSDEPRGSGAEAPGEGLNQLPSVDADGAVPTTTNPDGAVERTEPEEVDDVAKPFSTVVTPVGAAELYPADVLDYLDKRGRVSDETALGYLTKDDDPLASVCSAVWGTEEEIDFLLTFGAVDARTDSAFETLDRQVASASSGQLVSARIDELDAATAAMETESAAAMAAVDTVRNELLKAPTPEFTTATDRFDWYSALQNRTMLELLKVPGIIELDAAAIEAGACALIVVP